MASKTVSAAEVVALFRRALAEKWGYIWGGTGQIHTQRAQDSATRAQTIRYGQQWVGRRVADCSGLFWWAYKQLGGYMYHGSNTMWRKYAAAKGSLQGGKRTDSQPLKPARRCSSPRAAIATTSGCTSAMARSSRQWYADQLCQDDRQEHAGRLRRLH